MIGELAAVVPPSLHQPVVRRLSDWDWHAVKRSSTRDQFLHWEVTVPVCPLAVCQ